MTVERRYSARHRIDATVQILYRKRRFASARGLNLCTDGMYLKVQNITLPSGTLVELEIDARGRSWLVAAIVVHRHDEGIGVMFRDPQPRLFDELTRPQPTPYALPPFNPGREPLPGR